MKVKESEAFFKSINRGIHNLKMERNDWENNNKYEQFFSGIGAAIEKYNIFADGPYGSMSSARKEAQDLIHDYGGYFEQGVRFGITICEYSPNGEFEFRELDEKRVVETENFTFHK